MHCVFHYSHPYKQEKEPFGPNYSTLISKCQAPLVWKIHIAKKIKEKGKETDNIIRIGICRSIVICTKSNAETPSDAGKFMTYSGIKLAVLLYGNNKALMQQGYSEFNRILRINWKFDNLCKGKLRRSKF